MKIDIQVESAVVNKRLEEIAEQARAAGCTLFRFVEKDGPNEPHKTLRIEWPKEAGSKERSVWRRSNTSSCAHLMDEMGLFLTTLTH